MSSAKNIDIMECQMTYAVITTMVISGSTTQRDVLNLWSQIRNPTAWGT